ncbi:MAG: serpin family protein [Verrucomicrobia bacterium]|nr:serpin family protein [Verrucomicrobiota bacterium]
MKKLILLIPLLALSAQANDFASKLYDQLKSTEGNLFFSPASIEAALSMTQEGARGNTLEQFFQTLEVGSADRPTCFQGLEFENANAIWIDRTFPTLGTFETAVTEKYGAEIRAADFSTQPEIERVAINQWVGKKTRDKIQNLLPDGSVTTMTRLLLVNAIYFKGDWLHAFDPDQTSLTPFQTLENGEVEAPMMCLKETRFNYGENDCFQTLELPYKGEEVSMLILLPREPDGIAHVEECFSAGKLNACTAEMRKLEVNVFLPRFKVKSSLNSMKRTLAALGLTDAFDAQRADFSGISTEPLFIDDVVHKAFVEVNEEGTEAAAATGIIMRTTSIGPPPKIFRADHPFIFLIRENESGKILFMGRMCDPSK